MAAINNRSELIFLYDVKDNNPNGDPLNENKPRIDEETNLNYVTDVRLKRTIRDYIAKFYNNKAPDKIFMLAERKEDNTLKSITELSQEFISTTELVKSCIDIRLFGGTIAVKKDKSKAKEAEGKEESNAITGPVQFRLGRSMHKVMPVETQITRTVPNESNKTTGTFGYDQRLYYSLIKFYGVINENAAQCVNLSDADVQKLLQAMWYGSKELNTRSKIGHTPRLLLKVDYTAGFFIGDLDASLKIKSDMPDEQIRSPEDYVLEISKLNQLLNKYKDKIENIYLMVHQDMELSEPVHVEGLTVQNLEEQNWFNVYQMV
jgi:CRISPR-associated protein Csh2